MDGCSYWLRRPCMCSPCVDRYHRCPPITPFSGHSHSIPFPLLSKSDSDFNINTTKLSTFICIANAILCLCTRFARQFYPYFVHPSLSNTVPIQYSLAIIFKGNIDPDNIHLSNILSIPNYMTSFDQPVLHKSKLNDNHENDEWILKYII